jgi:hypothetical protein
MVTGNGCVIRVNNMLTRGTLWILNNNLLFMEQKRTMADVWEKNVYYVGID